MTLAAFTAYVAASAALTMALIAARDTRRVRVAARVLAARTQLADHDRDFARWASRTFLTVVDHDGQVHAHTIASLYAAGEEQWDQVWDIPVAVSLWHGDPDLIARYASDPEVITGWAERQTEEHGDRGGQE